jgi:hypothetical protein
MDVPNKMEVAGMVAVTTTRLLYAMASIAKATQAMGVWATEGGRGPKALSEVALCCNAAASVLHMVAAEAIALRMCSLKVPE